MNDTDAETAVVVDYDSRKGTAASGIDFTKGGVR